MSIKHRTIPGVYYLLSLWKPRHFPSCSCPAEVPNSKKMYASGGEEEKKDRARPSDWTGTIIVNYYACTRENFRNPQTDARAHCFIDEDTSWSVRYVSWDIKKEIMAKRNRTHAFKLICIQVRNRFLLEIIFATVAPNTLAGTWNLFVFFASSTRQTTRFGFQ